MDLLKLGEYKVWVAYRGKSYRPRVSGSSCGVRVPELGLQDLTLDFSATCVLNGAAGLAANWRICWTRLNHSSGQSEQGAESDQGGRHDDEENHKAIVLQCMTKEIKPSL